MVFESFNWLFFIALILVHFVVTGRIRLGLSYLSGIYFVYAYSPTSLAILSPVALLIIGPYLFQESETRNQFYGFMWLAMWGLYYLFVSNHNFDQREYFPYEILVLGAYNLARFYHVFNDLNFLRYRGPKWDEILAYLFFPPILFCGPLEKIQEFLKFYKNHACYKSIDYKGSAKLLSIAVFQGAIAEFCSTALTPDLVDFSEITLFPLIVYVLGIGWEIHFRLASYINFTRGFAWLMGYHFEKPNFQAPYSARSVAGFWSRWNMSLSRWTREYLFYGNIEDFSAKRVIIVLGLFWCLVGILHGISWHYFTWGLLMGSTILFNFAYIYARYHWDWLMKVDAQFIPLSVKRAVTIVWIHASCILLVPECEDIIKSLHRILSL